MKQRKLFTLIALMATLVLMNSSAYAAFCSLRDPVSAMQILYKDGYQYRSIVTTVTEQDRLAVKEKLPFTIHQSEVSKHTLYVLYKEGQHAGFLQARSEWAKWGLVEIAWGINLDRSLKGFYFQRCRSSECNDIVVASINKQLQNKSFNELKSLLSADGETLSEIGKKTFKKSPTLALLVLRSGLKTLAITDISWARDIKKIEGS
ncbi:hypothetical protein [Psychromonas sp. SR45-3]|uniref:hypothetical protein n=1 Tax=Psychromonas sp. SR45-3 TaxID=2760930 RepID=UPI0015FC6AE6|nr:hypothetical protein [Psychromonas sp. SR45-3]MBB1273077.1 hypothetical protein [Psychromonas sp. SR45-3]